MCGSWSLPHVHKTLALLVVCHTLHRLVLGMGGAATLPLVAALAVHLLLSLSAVVFTVPVHTKMPHVLDGLYRTQVAATAPLHDCTTAPTCQRTGSTARRCSRSPHALWVSCCSCCSSRRPSQRAASTRACCCAVSPSSRRRTERRTRRSVVLCAHSVTRPTRTPPRAPACAERCAPNPNPRPCPDPNRNPSPSPSPSPSPKPSPSASRRPSASPSPGPSPSPKASPSQVRRALRHADHVEQGSLESRLVPLSYLVITPTSRRAASRERRLLAPRQAIPC